jgi:hypothetical protein
MKRLTFLIGLFIVFQSCDPVGFYEYKVRNGLKENIEIDYKLWTQKGDSLVHAVVQPGDTFKIDRRSLIVSLPEKLKDRYGQEDTVIRGTELKVKVGQKLMTKDLMKRKEWEFKLIEKHLAEYIISIDTTDIE